MLDGRASSSSPAFLACMLQMPITFFPLVPTPQSAIELFEEHLYYRKRLYVLANEKLHAELLRLYYASPVAGHIGRAHTYEILFQEYH
jgi:hypothetical protein